MIDDAQIISDCMELSMKGKERSMADRNMRIEEFASRSGYKESTIRKKIQRREIGYRKVGRMVVIPESELTRILGEYREPCNL